MIRFLQKKNIILIILVIALYLILSTGNIYATEDIIDGAEDFLERGREGLLDISKIKLTSDTIFNIFSAIGTIIVIVVGIVLGIQFVMGSTEEKAKIKEALIPFIVGSIVIFGAFGIWSLVVKVFNEL